MQAEGLPLYRLDLPLRWGDMDALGHVNNAMYFRYFEQTRIAWMESLGVLLWGEQRASTSAVVVDNHAEYLLPVSYPASMVVRMGGHSPGRSSFITTYSLCVDEVLHTRGSAKVVWIDTRTGKSTPLPDSVRQLLQPGGQLG